MELFAWRPAAKAKVSSSIGFYALIVMATVTTQFAAVSVNEPLP